MIIQDNRLKDLVYEISASMPNMKREAYTKMVLHTQENDMFIDRLLFVDTSRDYVNNFSDQIQISFQMPLGDYIHHVYKHRDLLEVTLTHYTVGLIYDERYMAVILDNTGIKDGMYDNTPLNELNQSITPVKMQLMKKNIMKMRSKTVEGCFKNASPENVIKTLAVDNVNKHSSLFKVKPGTIKMIKPDNSRTYKHLIIPNGTPFNRMVDHIQNGEYGLYNGGANIYLQSSEGIEDLYIYPTHRPNLFADAEKILQIVAVTGDLLTSTEATYVVDNNIVKIICPSFDSRLYKSENRAKDKGLSIHTTEADSIRTRPYRVTVDDMFTSDSLTQKRILHRSLDAGKTPVNTHKATNNHYKTRSEVLTHDGFLATVNWNNSNARLLTPCMPVIYIVEEHGKVVSYEGVLQRVDYLVNNQNRTESSKLIIFIKQNTSSTGTVGK